MSQQGNLYPNMEQSKKGPPLPGTYVHVQQQPDHWSVESPRTPLIQGAPQYAIYNPKRAIVYAKKSKSHCCCVVGCVLCTFCCCLFFLISVILGGLVAAYAVQCGKVASDQVVFSSSLSNVTQLQFINYNGPISLSSSFDAENVTITVTRRAANSDEISRFTSIFNVENGQLYFEEQLPGKNNFWEAVINCVSSQIDIVFPAHLDQPLSLTVTSRNGDVSIDVTSRFAQAVLSTSNGNIHLNLSSDSISATTTNGNIDLASVSTKSLTGETTNGNVKSDGNITLVGVNETVTFDVSTTNGHIDISSLIASSRATIQMGSTNGDVSAIISRFAGSFDVKTTNGGTTVIGDQVHFTNQERKEKQGTVGNGLGSCNLSSTNGDVTATFS